MVSERWLLVSMTKGQLIIENKIIQERVKTPCGQLLAKQSKDCDIAM